MERRMDYAGAMPARVRPRRDFQQLEHRRKQAGRLFAAGKMILAAIARQLKVSRQSVSRWYTEWKSGGARALNGAGGAGGPQTKARPPATPEGGADATAGSAG